MHKELLPARYQRLKKWFVRWPDGPTQDVCLSPDYVDPLFQIKLRENATVIWPTIRFGGLRSLFSPVRHRVSRRGQPFGVKALLYWYYGVSKGFEYAYAYRERHSDAINISSPSNLGYQLIFDDVSGNWFARFPYEKPLFVPPSSNAKLSAIDSYPLDSKSVGSHNSSELFGGLIKLRMRGAQCKLLVGNTAYRLTPESSFCFKLPNQFEVSNSVGDHTRVVIRTPDKNTIVIEGAYGGYSVGNSSYTGWHWTEKAPVWSFDQSSQANDQAQSLTTNH